MQIICSCDLYHVSGQIKSQRLKSIYRYQNESRSLKVKYLTYLISIIFLISGTAKLLSLDFELMAFERWGYPLEFMYFTGIAEVTGSLAVLFNFKRKWALAGLCCLMLGAVATHMLHNEWPMLLIASLILMATSYMTLTHWKKTA